MLNTYHPQTVTHPKEILKEALEEKGIGAKEFAVRTGKPEKTISALLNGGSAITPEMAVLFEHVLQIPAHFWIKAQGLYDEYIAKVNYEKTIEDSISWAKEFDYAKMAKLGWVKPTRNINEKTKELLNFFGLADASAWEKYYINTELKLSFRASLKNTKEAHGLTAWLRHGQIQAQKITPPKYSKSLFKKKLLDVQKIMLEQPTDFFNKLQTLCLEAGVIVVYSPCLPGIAIHGATRWHGDVPVIQMSGRHKQNAIFWFTFFHEAGHILLHGKKYISLENIEYDGEDKTLEKEADNFAIKYTFSKELEAKFLKLDTLDDEVIKNFAQKHNLHPAMIVGRLQHKGIIGYSEKHHFFVPINLEP